MLPEHNHKIHAATTRERRTGLLELALLYLRLGATALGGPPAHIAMMEDEVVVRRRWLTREQFLDFLGATNLIPGPNSTEMAMYVGRVRAGLPGLLVAGSCFILPAALMVGALAWSYARFAAMPRVAAVLYAVKPVVIVIIAQGAFRLTRSAIRSVWLGALCVGAMVSSALGLDALLTLFAAGAVAGVVHAGSRSGRSGLLLMLAGGVPAAAPVSLGLLSLLFLKIGATMFGGGYVLVAFLRSDFVARLHWLTEHQLLDAVAIGQVTPGPLFTTATFIGYLLRGGPGAVLATIAIFLPAFVLVAISGPLVPRLRRSSLAGAVLDGINAAAIALMIVVSAQLARSAIVDWFTLSIAALSAWLLVRYRVNSTWLVAGAAIASEILAYLSVIAHRLK